MKNFTTSKSIKSLQSELANLISSIFVYINIFGKIYPLNKINSFMWCGLFSILVVFHLYRYISFLDTSIFISKETNILVNTLQLIDYFVIFCGNLTNNLMIELFSGVISGIIMFYTVFDATKILDKNFANNVTVLDPLVLLFLIPFIIREIIYEDRVFTFFLMRDFTYHIIKICYGLYVNH